MRTYIINFLDMASEACDELWRTRLRSNFTLVALIIGTAGLALLVCAYHLEVTTARLAERSRVKISLSSVAARADAMSAGPQFKRGQLLLADAAALESGSRHIAKALLNGDPRDAAHFAAQGNACEGDIRGSSITTSGAGDKEAGELAWGRYFTPAEIAGGAKVMIVNHALKVALFGAGRFFEGGRVKLEGEEYQVVGVEWPTLNRKPVAQIPCTTLQEAYLNIDWHLEVFIKPGEFRAAAGDINAILKERLGDPGTDFVAAGAISKEKFRLYGFAGAIGLLILISAGLAVANKTYIGALERLDQFAVRRALGATIRRTYLSVMLESVLLCGLGSLLGGILGWAVFTAFLAQYVEGLYLFYDARYQAPLLVLLLVAIITIGIGTAGGLQAARTAAKSEPAWLIGKRDMV